METKATPLYRIAAGGVLAIAGIAAVVIPLLASTPALAQGLFGWGEPPARRAPQQQFNPFGIFQPPAQTPRYRERPPRRKPVNFGRRERPERWERPERPERPERQERAPPEPPRQAPVESTRPPGPGKPDGVPITRVVVMGDAMADWLAYGIEDAYSDDSDMGIVRKIRPNAGLIRSDSRSDGYNWVQSARDILAVEKANFIVIMLGLADRQPMRERPAPKPAVPPPAVPPGQTPPPPPDAEPPAAVVTHEFRSEKWAEVYGKRIDEMIAVLKAKGVPVLWVGLPVIRGARGKADVLYLNDLYRRHAEKAGITYVDVWDGFVDDDGDYVQRGPDYDGQVRRLRHHDGIHFTKAGALKLGHYVERELQRLMQAKAPIASPIPDQTPQRPGGPVQRPDAGPVVSLTAIPGESDGLAGGGPARPPAADPVAARVLVKGETLAAAPGRADNFAWPRPEAAADANDVIPIVQPAPVVARPAPAAKKNPAPAERVAPKRPGQAAADTPQRQVR